MTTYSPSPATNSLDPQSAREAAALLKAMADPLRLRMLAAIAADPRGEVCVCDLSELSDVTQSTVSHHLKILRRAGLVTAERRGTWVHYRLEAAHHSTITSLIFELTQKAPTL